MSAATRMVSSRFSGCHRWRPHPPPWERARRRLPAGAFVNDIEIMVARGRLGQCGGGRDPRHTGRWRGGAGGVWVQGRKLHEFNLADPAECDRVVKTRVDAPADQRIEVLVVNQGGANRIAAPLTTVAADRVWRVECFADWAWGSVLSTATPTPAQPAPPSHAHRGPPAVLRRQAGLGPRCRVDHAPASPGQLRPEPPHQVSHPHRARVRGPAAESLICCRHGVTPP